LFFRVISFKKLAVLPSCYSSPSNHERYNISYLSGQFCITAEQRSRLTYTQDVTLSYKNVRKSKMPVLLYCYMFKLSTYLSVMSCCVNANLQMSSVKRPGFVRHFIYRVTYSVATNSPQGLCFSAFLSETCLRVYASYIMTLPVICSIIIFKKLRHFVNPIVS